MAVEIVGRLARFDDRNAVVGYLVSAGGKYVVGVTPDFAKRHGVVDVDIGQWLDVEVCSVVPAGRYHYAVTDRNTGFFDEFSSIPVTDFGDGKLYYGYLFDDSSIVPLDSEVAFDRMVKEASGSDFL